MKRTDSLLWCELSISHLEPIGVQKMAQVISEPLHRLTNIGGPGQERIASLNMYHLYYPRSVTIFLNTVEHVIRSVP